MLESAIKAGRGKDDQEVISVRSNEHLELVNYEEVLPCNAKLV